jgi:hypothetical protein
MTPDGTACQQEFALCFSPNDRSMSGKRSAGRAVTAFIEGEERAAGGWCRFLRARQRGRSKPCRLAIRGCSDTPATIRGAQHYRHIVMPLVTD